MSPEEEIFYSLGLEGWKVSGPSLGSGGQAITLPVEHIDGRKGAFRYIKGKGTRDIQRFLREVGVLTNPEFQHRNIVRILDHSEDEKNLWYISKRGESFKGYWKTKRKELKNHPDSLVSLAIQMIIQILDGLGPLHDEGVVHRDIKPKNIIMDLDRGERFPVLIDFGVIYVHIEDRLTSVDSAVGNIRYSPDVMMNRMDDIPPWLDVFQISQLLT